MKRTIAFISAAVLALGLSACGSDPAPTTPTDSSPAASSPAATPTTAGTLTKEDGKLVDTDKEATAIEGTGFAITIDPTAKTANFQFIDPATGDNFQDFSEFNFETNTFLRHHVVPAMGQTYNYNLEIPGRTLVSVTNATGEDVSASLKGSGRWDNSQTDTAAQAQAIEAYFLERYGMTIEDAVTGA